ncbi:hypothetical protein C0995_004357, partial [Termitomyces sp. Mi166
ITKVYESETYNYSIQIQESLFKLSLLLSYNIASFAANDTKGTNLLRPTFLSMPSLPQHKTLPHALLRSTMTASNASSLKNAGLAKQEHARLKVENAEDDLVHKTEIAIMLIKTVLKNLEPIKNLNKLTKAQLLFFSTAVEAFSTIQSEIEQLSVAAEKEYSATLQKQTCLMMGTGDPIHQADDAGVSPAPQAGEMPEASVYKPLPKQDDSDPCNVNVSFGMPGGLSVSWMNPILNPSAQPEERTFASGALPLLIYLELPKHIGQQQRSLDSLPQFREMAQGGVYAHSTPFRPPQTVPP